MNKEYTYINGNIIVEDEKGQKKLVDYCDNFEKILVQENVIEKTEKMIADLERITLNVKPENKILILSPLLATLFIPSVFIPLLFEFGGRDEIIDTIFGKMNQSKFLVLAITLYFSPFSAIASALLNGMDSDRIKHAEGKKLCLNYLKKYLEVEKERLKSLQKESKTLESSSGFKTSLINDQKEIKYLDYVASLYYDLGRNLKKYTRYYAQNNSLEKLEEHINVLGYENVINILENSASKIRKK